MNLFDDIRADSNKGTGECQHLWIWSSDKKSIYCLFCDLKKIIQEGSKLE
jgi:hypothetical protein